MFLPEQQSIGHQPFSVRLVGQARAAIRELPAGDVPLTEQVQGSTVHRLSADSPGMADPGQQKITKEDVRLAQGPVNLEANGQIPKGSLASKLQAAEAKGRTVEQTVQSLREAPGVSEQDAVPQALADKLGAGQPK